MLLFEILDIQDKQIQRLANKYGYIDRDLSNASVRTKTIVRNTNNDALAQILTDYGIKYKRKKVSEILDQSDIPDYEVGIVIGNNHINYHRKGFTGGTKGKDMTKPMDIVKGFKFITKEQN